MAHRSNLMRHLRSSGFSGSPAGQVRAVVLQSRDTLRIPGDLTPERPQGIKDSTIAGGTPASGLNNRIQAGGRRREPLSPGWRGIRMPRRSEPFILHSRRQICEPPFFLHRGRRGEPLRRMRLRRPESDRGPTRKPEGSAGSLPSRFRFRRVFSAHRGPAGDRLDGGRISNEGPSDAPCPARPPEAILPAGARSAAAEDPDPRFPPLAREGSPAKPEPAAAIFARPPRPEGIRP